MANNPDVDTTAERMFKRYASADRAIDAALDHRQSYEFSAPQFQFWDAVITKLKQFKKTGA